MGCLYIDRKNVTLKIASKALVIHDDVHKITSVPLGLIDRICIKGDIMLSASVLGHCGENDIAVLVLRGLQHKPTMLLPSIRQDARRRLIQNTLANDPKFCLDFAKVLMQKKLEGQYQLVMNQWHEMPLSQNAQALYTEQYNALIKQVERASNAAFLLGIEGSAAVAYFKMLAYLLPSSLQFSGRNRRPPKDPFNVVLSLGYTLLHYEWVRQIYLMGLDPYIGFYHTVHFGRESLASDLLEPMRPIYDQWALTLFQNDILRVEDFTQADGACQMGKAGRLRFYEAFEQWLKGQNAYFEEIKRALFATINGTPDLWMPIFNSEDEIFAESSLAIKVIE